MTRAETDSDLESAPVPDFGAIIHFYFSDSGSDTLRLVSLVSVPPLVSAPRMELMQEEEPTLAEMTHFFIQFMKPKA